MAQFSVNPERFGPYKGFRLKIRWDGRHVAGVNRTDALKRIAEVVEYQRGGDPSLVRRMAPPLVKSHHRRTTTTEITPECIPGEGNRR